MKVSLVGCKNDIPETVDARQDTTAEDIFSKCSNDMLKPMFTITNNKGSKGAPSHPAPIRYQIN